MPQIVVRSSITTGQTATPLSGSQFEYLPYNALVEIGVVCDKNLVTAAVSSGSDVLQEDGPVALKTVDVLPVYPDDFPLQDVAAAGDRLKVLIRNGNAATTTVYTVVRITPL